MKRRRVSRLPRGPALVAAGLLGLFVPGCGKKKEERQEIPPQTEPPQPAPDATANPPPQMIPAGDAATPVDAGVEDAAAAPADAKRSLDNLPGKLKPVPDDRRIKDIKAPQPKPPQPKPQEIGRAHV